MSFLAGLVVALVFGPFTVIAFLLDPGGFLARNGAFAVGYLGVATLGTALYTAGFVRLAGMVWRRIGSASGDTAGRPSK
ncbi:hypothetical protein SAMN06269185_0195 [Natronoarchaeum philippinense]|uniref:Integral membrane protein n=1 Tax=Natronoarchaeum philippinense TaxID=558529 RepID=A0A285N1A7_NATPI|nr:hypothetical protein [Natronoarchaeum philippinense]SNZ03118.1 hypothetical protein SAMN06269185_0195 [Natronoarchaeum philippinense]